MSGGGVYNYTWEEMFRRQAEALERIADALEKMSTPTMVINEPPTWESVYGEEPPF